MRFFLCVGSLFVVWAMASHPLAAVDLDDTRLLSDPAISGERVAFAYDGDLWVALRDGSSVRRLTSDVGVESAPRFSPDGHTIAFSAEYDGNVDVFVVPTAGGVPRRLTWHPADDEVEDFTPDGEAVLFSSARNAFTNRYRQLYLVTVGSSLPGAPFPTRLPIPNGMRAAYSPDGGKIAYIPVAERFQQWKHYRGGTASRIWIYDTADHSVLEVPQPEGRCNDTDPEWIGARLFFRSDRAGELNVFAFDPKSGEIEQQTRFEDFPVLALSGDGERLILEQAGYLHVLEPGSTGVERLRIGVASDLIETRGRWVDGGAAWIRGADLSPSGARAAIEFRGEIVTLPAEKGDPRYLTRTPGANERSPVWSPDGTTIAYFSDQAGEYQLHLRAQNASGEPQVLEVAGNGFYSNPEFSPDGKKLSYTDNSLSLYWIDLESGASTLVASEPYYRQGPGPSHSWSPDSRWLAYARGSESYLGQIWVHDTRSKTSTAITDGLSDAQEPVFDRAGKLLFFRASTDAGPVRHWFAMSNADMVQSSALYVAVLAAGEPSPLAPESDEENDAEIDEADEEDDEEDTEASSKDGDNGDDEAKEKERGEGQAKKDGDKKVSPPAPVTIDFEDLSQRILALPVPSSEIVDLEAGVEGVLFYRRRSGPQAPWQLYRFSLEEREEKSLLEEVDGFDLSADGKKLLFVSGGKWEIADAKDKIERGKAPLAIDAVRVWMEPRAEWQQIYDEAWRINRDYFYDPGMHGEDWPGMREQYAQFLPDLATRADLNRVLQWMSSELAVGHHRVGGGDRRARPESVPGGLLGCDFAVDTSVPGGRYRFERVFGGLNWNPELRAPLTEPGVEVRPGEYLLAVDGRPLDATENVYARFESTANRIVTIEVGSDPQGSDARTVEVVPIESEAALRNRAWIEGNLRRVEEATQGRVAYVYVPNTTRQGHEYFKRYFYAQVDKEAVIVDERFNGGGQVADYVIDLLRRPYISNWATRYGADLRTPSAAILGPKVMLIDETAGSGGDLLPWMFHKLEIGTLVGKRTWGGLVGILGFPVLMDGGVITAPNLAIWTEDGFVVENEGVPPDVEVEQWPAEIIAGRDPQLEKAIEIALEELERNPPPAPAKPPYPLRARP